MRDGGVVGQVGVARRISLECGRLVAVVDRALLVVLEHHDDDVRDVRQANGAGRGLRGNTHQRRPQRATTTARAQRCSATRARYPRDRRTRHACRRSGARGERGARPGRSQDHPARAGGVSRSRDAARLRRAGRHRVRRRGGRTRGRHRLAGRDPLRGRAVDVVAEAAYRRGARDAALDRRRRRHRRDHRLLRAPVVRPVVGRGVPARLGGRIDRCGRGVRDAAAHAASPRDRAHARGGVGRQRPGRDRLDARADRLDRAAALRRRRPRRPARQADRHRARVRARDRGARDVGLRTHPADDRVVRAGRIRRDRRARIRRRRRRARQRVPERVPRRARRRVDAVALPRAARHVPRGHRVRRPGRALHRPRAARLPVATCRTSRSRASGSPPR